MSDLKMEDLVEEQEVDSTSETTTTEEVVETTTEQDLLKTELDRVQKSGGRTELEKAQYSLKMNAERLEALGGNPKSILGMDKEVDEDLDEDEKPITVGMWKKMQQDNAVKSALQMADEIPNETERELAKWHLQNTIKSTGNPSKDLELANSLVNAVKNKQILEEIARKNPAKTHSSSSSAPARTTEQEVELNQDELAFMKPPFNLTKEQVLKARK